MKNLRKGFTLIELLVVIAMMAILIGAVGSSVQQARKRAMIARATQDIKEMTNAILAYENYAPNRSLESVQCSWKDADKSAIAFLLGNGSTDSGGNLPVLYNAHVQKDYVRDPWGTPYQFQIKAVGKIQPQDNTQYKTALSIPNLYRLTDSERRIIGNSDKNKRKGTR